MKLVLSSKPDEWLRVILASSRTVLVDLQLWSTAIEDDEPKQLQELPFGFGVAKRDLGELEIPSESNDDEDE